jgi:hypothetical protein
MVALSPPQAQGWGDTTNSWLGSIDSTEKDLNSLPDWIKIYPWYEGNASLTRGSEQILDSIIDLRLSLQEEERHTSYNTSTIFLIMLHTWDENYVWCKIGNLFIKKSVMPSPNGLTATSWLLPTSTIKIVSVERNFLSDCVHRSQILPFKFKLKCISRFTFMMIVLCVR